MEHKQVQKLVDNVLKKEFLQGKEHELDGSTRWKNGCPLCMVFMYTE